MAAEGVFVVTGGTGGMGLATARELVSQGSVLLVDISDERLAQAQADVVAGGATVHTLRCDVSSDGDVAQLAPRIEAIGRFRALVHTAGISPEMADARRVLDVDLGGSVRVTNAVFPLVTPGCVAVLIGSIAGYADIDPSVEPLLDDPLAEGFFDGVERALGRPLDPAMGYVLAKRGVVRLVERLAAPWGERGARTVAITPGLIDTTMGRMELARQPIMPLMVDATPVKRPDAPLPGRPEDIARTAAFLISDGAAFISGCDIRVDGGLMGAGRHMLGLH